MAEERLVWGSEKFIDAILDDMRAAAQLFEMDETEITPLTQQYIDEEKLSVANHVDFIDVYRETLDRTDLPEGMSKAEAADKILLYIEAAQYKQRTEGTGTIDGIKIPELGVTDLQAQDPEFKNLFSQQFIDVDESIKIVGIFGSTRTTPDGPSFVYAEINDIFDFVEYDRRELFKLDKETSDATIDAVKKTMLDRGYLFDIGESYKSSIAFPVMLGMNGRIQIGEGNHRLRAAFEISQETGKKVYVPIYAYPMGTVQYGGLQTFSPDKTPYRGRSRFVGEQILYDALRQLLFDAGASEYTVNEKIGETLGANKGYAGSNYLGAGGSGGSQVSQENVKKFFDAIGVETLTYDELPEDNVYKTGVNNLTDTTNLLDDVDKLQDSINNYLNEIILENPSRPEDLAIDPLTLTLSDDGKSIDITELVIDENYRNQGLGTEVFDDIKAFANDNNLSITTTPFVGELEDLVKKQGFVEVRNDAIKSTQYILKPDTPTNVVDEVSELQDALRNKYKNELDELYIIKRPFYDPIKNINTENGIFIEEIVIKPEFRGSGVGTKIVDDIKKFATENNYGIELEPVRGQNAVIRFWENQGFELQEYFDDKGNLITDNKELDNVYKWTPNTPTNVVDEGIELFHGRGKGSRVPENLHAGTYQAAVDRNAFMFGSENMYEMIYKIKNDFVDEVSDALSYILVDNQDFSATEYLQPEVYLPNGNVDTYDIRIDVLQDGTLNVVIGKNNEEIATVFSDGSVGYVIDELEDGTNLYSQINQEKLENIIQDRDVDKYFGEAGGFLDPDRSFKYKDGYQLYRVTISPNAKIVEFTEDIQMVLDGKPKSIDPDIFVNYLESGNLDTVDEILLPNGKTITLSGSNKEKINTIKNEMDVVGYRNQMEDVGSTSYYFLNQDSYTETPVDAASNKQFDEDVLKKFVENDPYRDLAAFDTAPIDRQRLAKTFMGEVEDIADGKPLLETRMLPGDDRLQWANEVIKPNKIFNPDKWTKLVTPEGEPHSGLDDPGKYVWNDTPEFNASEWYSRVITNNATDEDITKFFIYLASHSETSAYARQQFKNADAIADIVKIGIFSDLPIDQIIPMGQPYYEGKFINELKSNNSLIGDEIYKVLVNLVNEQGQFANLKETMRNVILEAHRDIYAANPNDYFIVWRGGPLNRFVPWQSTSKSYGSAQGIMYQMVQGGYGGGRSVDTYVVHKNNMIDLDALGLSYSNEKEIIVLTEELKSSLAKRPTTIEGRRDIRNILDWWLLARTREDAFPKDGKKITNLFRRLTDAGQATQEFFSDVIDGIDPRYKPQKPYQQIIELNNPKLYAFQDDYNAFIKGGGNFNQHIFTSIPTFYETQVAKMQGITNMIEKNPLDDLSTYKILDIGGTEGAWAKALAKNNPNLNIEILDPNRAAMLAFESGDIVTNANFFNAAFTHVVEDQGKMFVEGGITSPVQFLVFNENTKYDIVHESMAFQFISDERADQIKYIKENVLNTNGVLIIEEKFSDNNQGIYDANEIQKNNFKSQYYTQEQLADKKLNVLLDMEGNQISVQEVQKILGENFNHVEQYWDAGNFKGFIASDSPNRVSDFTTGINDVGLSLTNHTYSTAPTDTDIKGALEKKMFNNGTDSKLAGQIAEETVKQNPNFFKRAAQTINNFDSTLASIKLLGRLGVVAAPVLNTLARTAPLYAPGDVIIERAIDKVVPYLDDAAARLGLGRIPFNKLLPTYMAYEIGVAGADLVQAAMYAYETAAKNNQPSNFQIGLTKLLLPKAYEEEAIKKSQMPGDLQAFYNTPTGQKVAEELDFGSQFLKELENEKISKYSPGWGLTKGIFSMLGDLYKAGQNPSDYTTKYRDSRASMYNVGFTGSNR